MTLPDNHDTLDIELSNKVCIIIGKIEGLTNQGIYFAALGQEKYIHKDGTVKPKAIHGGWFHTSKQMGKAIARFIQRTRG